MGAPDLAQTRDAASNIAEHLPPAPASIVRVAAKLLEHARKLMDGEAADTGAALAELPAHALGALLKERRSAARLSLRDLARRTRLSINTIRDLEHGHRTPAAQTVARLVSVSELGLDRAAVPALSPQQLADTHMLPRYDRRGLINEMRATLNSAGGHLEQTCLYLDDDSAEDWTAIANAPGYVEANRALPMPAIARAAITSAGPALDIIALGPGDGLGEINLCKALLAAGPRVELNLFLLDISHSLLHQAHQRAKLELAPHGVRVESLHGDFHHLARYEALQPWPGNSRRRLYVLLGGTIANLSNELQFVRNSLAPALSGDLMLLDCVLGYADASDPEAVRRADPVLAHPVGGLAERWLGGLLQRYCRDLAHYQLGTELLVGYGVPGSYEIEFHADVTRSNGQRQRYNLARARRYDREKLIAALAPLGWTPVHSATYGPAARCAALLLRKT